MLPRCWNIKVNLYYTDVLEYICKPVLYRRLPNSACRKGLFMIYPKVRTVNWMFVASRFLQYGKVSLTASRWSCDRDCACHYSLISLGVRQEPSNVSSTARRWHRGRHVATGVTSFDASDVSSTALTGLWRHSTLTTLGREMHVDSERLIPRHLTLMISCLGT